MYEVSSLSLVFSNCRISALYRWSIRFTSRFETCLQHLWLISVANLPNVIRLAIVADEVIPCWLPRFCWLVKLRSPLPVLLPVGNLYRSVTLPSTSFASTKKPCPIASSAYNKRPLACNERNSNASEAFGPAYHFPLNCGDFDVDVGTSPGGDFSLIMLLSGSVDSSLRVISSAEDKTNANAQGAQRWGRRRRMLWKQKENEVSSIDWRYDVDLYRLAVQR